MAEGNLQGSVKYNPKDVKEEFGDKPAQIKEVESDKARQEKYGWLGATLVTEGENYVDNKIDTINNDLEMGKAAASAYMETDALAQLPPEEQIAEIEKEAEEAKQAEEDAKKAQEQEAKRIEVLQKQYIVNGAMTECSFSPDRSYVVIPISHGEYINNIAQLNVGDCMPNTNIISFKVCQSPSNPSVKAAAKEVLKEAQDRNKGFFDRFMDLFGAPSEVDEDKIDSELLAQCAGDCQYWIDGDLTWIDGEETVIVDGKPGLLGRCTLMCGYGGVIKLYTSGQEK
jgi:hypothetical protein